MQFFERFQRALQVREKARHGRRFRPRELPQELLHARRSRQRRVFCLQDAQQIALEILNTYAHRTDATGAAAAEWQMALLELAPPPQQADRFDGLARHGCGSIDERIGGTA